jgi:hypothetical protein
MPKRLNQGGHCNINTLLLEKKKKAMEAGGFRLMEGEKV